MEPLIILTLICQGIYFFISREKDMIGIKKGLKMFIKVLPTLLLMLTLVSIVLFMLYSETLVKYMDVGSGVAGWITAAIFGPVALISGYIAYPLCEILVKSEVEYSLLKVFITILMMARLITFPEAKFFQWKKV